MTSLDRIKNTQDDFIQVHVPDGQSGQWKVDTFICTEEESLSSYLRASFQGINSYIPQGQYKRLSFGNETVMSNTPMEVRTNRKFIEVASGHILINGLGLGMILNRILDKDSVKSITVVERSPDVIKLVAPTYSSSPKLSIHLCDAFDFQPPVGLIYDAVWHDIWTYISADNIKEMRKLHDKYKDCALWQGAWCYEECLAKWNDIRATKNLIQYSIDPDAASGIKRGMRA